jgi:undecaprenyl pyrophosphate synthase
MDDELTTVRQRALDLVRDRYDQVASIARVDLKAVNRPRPVSMQYGSRREIVREFLAVAGEVATFAVTLGLITPDQARQAILDFAAAHPELVDEPPA